MLAASVALVAVVGIGVVGVGGVAQATTAGPTIDNSSLYNGGRPCSTDTADPPAVDAVAGGLQALGADPSAAATGFRYTFVIAPTDGSAAPTSLAVTTRDAHSIAYARTPDGTLADGETYAWSVQLRDSKGTSPWSQSCVFRYDVTAPARPAITSSNYPPDGAGPVGQLARFTFSSSADTAGFLYVWDNVLPTPTCPVQPRGDEQCPSPLDQPGGVRVDRPGVADDVALSPPDWGSNTLTVAALDAAGNESYVAEYSTFVPDSAPAATASPGGQLCGTDPTLNFAPGTGVTGVVSYRYSTDVGTTFQAVRARPNGTAIAHMVRPSFFGLIYVMSVSADGYVSTQGDYNFHIGSAPGVSSSGLGRVGVPLALTFTAPDDTTPVAYRWYVAPGTKHRVPAVASGSATVPYTPSSPGPHTMVVTALARDGSASCRASYPFNVSP